MKSYLLLVMLAYTLLLSCKKGDGGPSKTENLTTGTWKLTGYMTDHQKDGVYEENTYAILADCEKDNLYTFMSSGNMTKDEGPTMCIPGNPQTVTQPWNFQDNENSLHFLGVRHTIEELSATTMKLKARISYNVIFTIDTKTTYTKQ